MNYSFCYRPNDGIAVNYLLPREIRDLSLFCQSIKTIFFLILRKAQREFFFSRGRIRAPAPGDIGHDN